MKLINLPAALLARKNQVTILSLCLDKIDTMYYGLTESFEIWLQESYPFCKFPKETKETVLLRSASYIGEFSLATGLGVVGPIQINGCNMHHLTTMYGAREFQLGEENLNLIRAAFAYEAVELEKVSKYPGVIARVATGIRSTL